MTYSAAAMIQRPATTHLSSDTSPAVSLERGGALIHRALAVLALLALLRWAAPLLIPLAAAAVLWLLFSPIADALERRRVPAVIGAATLSFLPPLVIGAGAMLAVPACVEGGRAATASLRRMAALLEPIALRGGAEGAAARWLASRIAWDGDAAMRWLESRAPEAALSTASALMLLFFLLLGQRSMRAALLRALPDLPARQRLLASVDEARSGVVAFIGVMGLMNLALAIATGLALAGIGLPNPAFWALLCFVLVFVPYLGPAAVAVMLLVAGSRAYGTGAAMFAPAAAFLALHAIEANFVSPWLMGQRLQLGRPALLVAVMVGAWMWGVVGGLLAVPLLIALAAALRASAVHPVLNALLAAEGTALPVAPVTPLRRQAPAAASRPRACEMPHPGPTFRPMRIAFVTETYPPEINGVALTVARAVLHLRRAGHEIELIRPRQRGERRGGEGGPGEWRSSGYPIPVYPAMRFGLARPTTLARRFEASDVDLVHVATEGPLGWAAVEAANRLGLPVTSDFRTNFHQYSKYYRLGWFEPVIGAYLRRLHNRTARSFAPTRQVCRDLGAAGFERVVLAGRGVDLERFSPARRDPALRERWGAGPGPVLLHVGRLAPEKNVELALQAFRNAQRQAPAARMVVVGDGPQRAALERAYPEVRFVGTQTGTSLAAHYASADLFLFPSLSDTFGNVTLEALASGLPVVAFDVAAASDLVVDRVNGRTVTPDNRAAFVLAVSLLTLGHEQLGPMRTAARRTAEALDWDSVLQRFEWQLQDTIDAHSHVAATAEPCPA